jgi:CheY-like chemotaxis protein
MPDDDGRPKTILIVDDDDDFLAIIAGALEDEGYATVCARNGAAALAYLRSSAPQPCMILLDLTMPVMDGWAFRCEQQRDPSVARICTTVMTGFKNLRQRNVHADHFLAKPLRVEALLEMVEQCCGRSV